MFIFFLLLIHIPSHVHSQTTSESALETRALLSLKSTITSDPASALATWTPATPYCKWAYITCDSKSHVTSLNLTSLDLSGTLSSSVSNLSHIINVTITGTQLAGPIPPSLFLIPTVRYLNFSNNLFNGTFPLQLSHRHVSNIEVIDLYNNEMTDDLPVTVASLPKLIHLHLGGNYFTGRIPPEYGQFPTLQYLSLAGNALSGEIPPEIGNVSTLIRLYLGYYNTFSGGIPPEIGNLTNLVRFDVAYTGLTGQVPPELSKLKNLDTLFLQVNNFTGELTPELGSLKGLKSMDLSNNQFSGEIPITFVELKNLTLLNLFRNRLHGSIPDFVSDLPELEVIQLWENNFTGIVPQNLGLNGKLKIVDVSTNMLTGTLPPNICNGNRLETLIVYGNSLSGPIPESLGDCQSIVRVRMGGNYFNGTIPEGIFSLPQLNLIELEGNLLSGFFPKTYLVQFNLGEISLSNNMLTGPLPASIGNFSAVQKLLLDGNEFSGPIPMEIGQLQQLSKVDFANNNFSGEIPPEISKCGVLGYMDLSRNHLSGQIPIKITTMPVLNYLNLSRNRLDGPIPGAMATMQSLTSLDLSYNDLSGLIPNTGQFSYFNSSSFIGNPTLCGLPLGECSGGDHRGHVRGLSPTFKLLLVIGLLLLSIAFVIVAVIKGRAIKRAGNAHKWKLTTFQRLDFTCDDVLESLKEDNIIGKGGAGIVYKGAMPSGEQVAVKRFPNIGRGSSHDHGFGAEIQTLGRIRHRYIVKLLGFCSNNETNLLIYEYMPNGSLGEVLHGKKGGHFHWDTRYKIAVEAAKGLCYLHHDCSPLIIHRDVKSNNILLDSDYEAHVADFGLAKFLQGSGTSESMSAIAGSYGYIAPEYAYTLKVDEKSDVYSYGVVLLELVCGKKPVGEFGDGIDIVQWVKNKTGGKIEQVIKVIDSRLPTIPIHEVMHVFYVAMLCVEEQAVERPTMREVVQILTDLPIPPPKQNQEDLIILEASPSPTHITALDSPTESLSLPFPRS